MEAALKVYKRKQQDCLPRALTPGVVDLVAAASSYVQPGDGKKKRKIVKPYKALYRIILSVLSASLLIVHRSRLYTR